MDTSETYIKMCNKAKEIQVLAPKPTILGGNFWHYPEGATGAPIVWLPRQDQLQEIYQSFRNENSHDDETAPLDAIQIAQDFNEWLETFTKKEPYSWLNNPTDIRGWVQPSMERLWLVFLYKQKYNKVWNGEEWIN